LKEGKVKATSSSPPRTVAWIWRMAPLASSALIISVLVSTAACLSKCLHVFTHGPRPSTTLSTSTSTCLP